MVLRAGLALLTAALVTPASGQVVLDGSFGASGALAGPNYTITPEHGSGEGGPNLFHSFSAFSLTAGESATLTGSASILNILARVTGPAASSIDGTLRSSAPNADLFFINPNGVIFGPNARLDVQGSFHVSSADYVTLGDGGRFDAADPGRDNLTIDSPSGFGFASPSPAAISIAEATLEVPAGEVLGVVGGDVEIDAARLASPRGTVYVASAASAGVVGLPDPAPSLRGFERLGDVTIAGTGLTGNLDVPGGGGRIYLRGGRLFLVGGVVSNVTGGVGPNIGPGDDAGVVDVVATERVSLSGLGRIDTRSSRSARSGDIRIETGSFTMEDRASVVSQSLSDGDSGNVDIVADQVVVRDSARISSGAFRGGRGGDIQIDAGTVDLSGNVFVSSRTAVTGAGAGSITIEARSLAIRESAQIDTDTTVGSPGDAGLIRVVLEDALTMSGSALLVSSTFTAGAGGRIEVSARELSMTDNAIISTASFGDGPGGDVIIEVEQITLADAATILTGTEGPAPGGDLTVSADRLRMEGRSGMSALSRGAGFAGDIEVTATEEARLLGGSITTEAGQSDGGDIVLNAETLIYLQNARITTSVSDGDGDGGNISIDPISVVLNNSQIVANANGGAGGNILIVADNFFIDDASTIDASSALGLDGTVVIRTPSQDVSGSVTALPTAFHAAPALIAQRCGARTRGDVSSFVVTGRDGVPPSPDDLLGGRAAGAARVALSAAEVGIRNGAAPAVLRHLADGGAGWRPGRCSS